MAALTPKQKAEMASFEKKRLSPDKKAELAEFEKTMAAKRKEMQEFSLSKEIENKPELGTVGKAIHALDYPRGMVGEGAAALIEKLTGKKLTTPEEIKAAAQFKKPFPSSADLLRRAGMGEDSSISKIIPQAFEEPSGTPWYKPTKEGTWYKPEKGGILDISGRDVLGTGLDIAGDPLTYVPGGLAVKAGKKALSPLAKLFHTGLKTLSLPTAPARAAGKALTKHTFRRAQQLGKREGQDVFSTLKKHDIWGTANSRLDKIDKIREDVGSGLGAITDEAGKLGSKTTVRKPFHDFLVDIRKKARTGQMDGDDATELRKTVKKMSPYFRKRGGKTELTPTVVENLKRRINDKVKKFEEHSSYNAIDHSLKSFAKDLHAVAEKEVKDTLGEGVVKKFRELNKDYGNLTTARKVTRQQAESSANLPIQPWSLSAMLGTKGNPTIAGAYMGKTAADLMGLPTVTSVLGKGLTEFGTSKLSRPFTDALGRRVMIDYSRPQQDKMEY